MPANKGDDQPRGLAERTYRERVAQAEKALKTAQKARADAITQANNALASAEKAHADAGWPRDVGLGGVAEPRPWQPDRGFPGNRGLPARGGLASGCRSDRRRAGIRGGRIASSCRPAGNWGCRLGARHFFRPGCARRRPDLDCATRTHPDRNGDSPAGRCCHVQAHYNREANPHVEANPGPIVIPDNYVTFVCNAVRDLSDAEPHFNALTVALGVSDLPTITTEADSILYTMEDVLFQLGSAPSWAPGSPLVKSMTAVASSYRLGMAAYSTGAKNDDASLIADGNVEVATGQKAITQMGKDITALQAATGFSCP